ncbi:MAG TPA: VPLPA-CTERM sorting domain-containing protein [Steroidobacteraceae bacterium]|nr:VPLPA-CTERM sorting domain-containing protein [Steroidobacteraceae bacterium]
MKFSIKPVALTVAMALASFGAQAQTLPSYGSTSPADGGKNDGLYLAVWDDTTKATDLVDLTSLYSDVAFISGSTQSSTTELTSPTSAYSVAANPTGAPGTVLQLNLGTISNFASTFGSVSSSTHYVVVGAENTSFGVVTSGALGSTYTGGAENAMASAILGESSNWAFQANSSPLVDLTGTAAYSALTGPLADGTEGPTSQNFGVNVGTAAGFYNYGKTSSRSGLQALTYSFNGQQGFWFLSSTGDLTWNLINSVSSVPLPPAVWLFASGLIGLALIGRRRQNGLGAAV